MFWTARKLDCRLAAATSMASGPDAGETDRSRPRGAWPRHQIPGVDELLNFAKDDTTIVPGHGPVGTKAMMREYRQMLVVARDRIQRLKAAGKTEDEVVAAEPNADCDAKYGLDARSNGNFVRVVYRSLKN
jgi:hypothetical protein